MRSTRVRCYELHGLSTFQHCGPKLYQGSQNLSKFFTTWSHAFYSVSVCFQPRTLSVFSMVQKPWLPLRPLIFALGKCFFASSSLGVLCVVVGATMLKTTSDTDSVQSAKLSTYIVIRLASHLRDLGTCRPLQKPNKLSQQLEG